MSDIGKIQQHIDDVLPDVITLRRAIHREPEIHFNEFKTREKIAAALAGVLSEIREPILETDFIGELSGQDKSRTIILRADMDALPIYEETGADYQSKYEGLMHACGHDAHSAMLVGAAKVLAKLQDQLPVNVRFVFQPAEEMVAGGARLVAGGACDDVECAYALHGWPGLPLNQIATRPGALMAAAGTYKIRCLGKGGHAGMPELTRNPIFTAVRIAEAIDQLQKKELDKRQAVLSVSSIQAGHASNVVPDEAVIEGTSRFFNVDDGAFIEKAFKEIIAAEDGRDDIKVVLDYEVPYSLPLVNSDNAFQHIKATATGLGDFYELDEPVKTAEDFAFYLNACGGAMFWLGLGEDWPKLHTATFNFNEEALVKGISMFCHLALSYK